jgi:hypothetical protein
MIVDIFKALKQTNAHEIGSTHKHLQLKTKHQQWFKICAKLKVRTWLVILIAIYKL